MTSVVPLILYSELTSTKENTFPSIEEYSHHDCPLSISFCEMQTFLSDGSKQLTEYFGKESFVASSLLRMIVQMLTRFHHSREVWIDRFLSPRDCNRDFPKPLLCILLGFVCIIGCLTYWWLWFLPDILLRSLAKRCWIINRILIEYYLLFTKNK